MKRENGVSDMSAAELLRGNMLIILANCAAITFSIIWGNIYDGSIRSEFALLRRKEMLYEAKRVIAAVTVLSVFFLGLYYFLSYLMGEITFSIWQIIFVVLTISCTFFVLQRGRIVGIVLLVVAILFLLPLLAICFAFVKRQCLDVYCSIYSILLFVIEVPAIYSWIQYWRKGDL